MDSIREKTFELVKDLQSMSENADKLTYNIKNIRRLKRRSIAELTEDRFAKYLYDVLENNNIEIYINANLKGLRPDIAIIKNNEVIAIIELKMNFGWCRNIFDPVGCEYKEKSQIHKRFESFENIRMQDIKFDDGMCTRIIRINNKCNIYYISTSDENYISKRNMIDDYNDFIKRNKQMKNKVLFYIISGKYHYDKSSKIWPSLEDINKSIDKLLETEYGMSSLIEHIKMAL